jgi:hypothetical protein
MTNREDVVSNGGVGEGGRGEDEDCSGGRSTIKPVSSTEPVGINNNNQPMMVVTVSKDVRTQRAIEQQVREARQNGEDGRGGRSGQRGGRSSMTKPTTKEEGGGNNDRATNNQQTMGA